MSHKVINNIDVLIMCGGKSGSSTLYVTLKKNYKCLKIHSYLDYIEQFNSNKLYESIDESSNNRKRHEDRTKVVVGACGGACVHPSIHPSIHP